MSALLPKTDIAIGNSRMSAKLSALVFWFVHIFDKRIDLSNEFYRRANGADTLNSGPQLLHFRHNQVSGELLAAKTKLRSCVIKFTKVRPSSLYYELSKGLCPFFVQPIICQPLISRATCKVVSWSVRAIHSEATLRAEFQIALRIFPSGLCVRSSDPLP